MNCVNRINAMRMVSSGGIGFLSSRAAVVSQYLGLKITTLAVFPIGIAISANLISSLIIQKTGILKEKNFVKREACCFAITLITTVALAVLFASFTGTALGFVLASSALLGIALRVSSLIIENGYSLLVVSPYCKNLESFMLDFRQRANIISLDQGLHFTNYEPLAKMIGYKGTLYTNRLFLSMHFEENKKIMKAEYLNGFERGVVYNDLNEKIIWSCDNVLENKDVFEVLSSEMVTSDCFRTGLPDLLHTYRVLKNIVNEEKALLKNLSTTSSCVQRLDKLKLQIKQMVQKTRETIACWQIISKREALIWNAKDKEKIETLQNKWQRC